MFPSKLYECSLTIFAAVTIETWALIQLLSRLPPPHALPLLLLGAHIAAAILFSIALLRLLQSYSTVSNTSSLPFLAVALFVPLLGMLGTLLLLLFVSMHNPNLVAVSLPLDFHDVPHFPESSRYVEHVSANIDPATIAMLLARSHDTDTRLVAIIYTLRLQDADAVSLLRIALKDPVEDLRLLAYSLLNRKQQDIYDRIDSTTVRLRHLVADPPPQILFQQLVCAYWDLVYFGFAEGETARFLLSRARAVAIDGLNYHPRSAGLHFQLGRILLVQHELTQAASAFQYARALGTDGKILNPYLAEIAYHEQRFCDIRKLLASVENDPSLRLSASAEYWTEVSCEH